MTENYYQTAQTAFKSGDYKTAYENYSKTVENNSGDWRAVYYRGYCVAKLSLQENFRIQEFKNAINSACEMLNNNPVSLLTIYEETFAFVEQTMPICTKSEPFKSEKLAKRYYEILYGLVSVMVTSMDIITDDMMKKNPLLEQKKQQQLEYAIRLADKSLEKAKYIEEFRTVETKNGEQQTEVVKAFTLSDVEEDEVKAYRKNFVSAYNDLPSIRKTVAEFERKQSDEQVIIDQYKSSLKVLWKKFPDSKKPYEKKYALMWLILTGIVFLFSLICLISNGVVKTSNEFFGGFLYGISFVGFGGTLIFLVMAGLNYNRGKKIKAEIEKAIFTDSLREEKQASKNAAESIKNINRMRKKYSASNMRK